MKNIILTCFILILSFNLHGQDAGYVVYNFSAKKIQNIDTVFFRKSQNLFVRGGDGSNKITENKALSKSILVFEYIKYYTDFSTKQGIKQRNLEDGEWLRSAFKFEPVKWEIDQTTTKEIQGYKCYRASNDDTGMVVWYTPHILSVGLPDANGLPGILLELNYESGTQYKAQEVKFVDVPVSKFEVTEGELVSAKKYEKALSKTEKWLDKMDKMTSQELGIDSDDN